MPFFRRFLRRRASAIGDSPNLWILLDRSTFCCCTANLVALSSLGCCGCCCCYAQLLRLDLLSWQALVALQRVLPPPFNLCSEFSEYAKRDCYLVGKFEVLLRRFEVPSKATDRHYHLFRARCLRTLRCLRLSLNEPL